MAAYLVLLLAAFSRLLPPALHGTAHNVTAVGAGMLFFGSRLGRMGRWQAASASLVMAVTDVILTRGVYGYPFHVRGYLVTWAWYAAICLIASGVLRKVTPLRVVAGVFASATGFYLVVDFALWAMGSMYPHTAAGLGACYVAALPFYGYDLASTAFFSAALFGIPVLAARLTETMNNNVTTGRPLA